MSSVTATVSHVLASDEALFVRATRVHAYMLYLSDEANIVVPCQKGRTHS